MREWRAVQRLVALGGMVATTLVLGTAVALAHPFGLPPSAEISVDGKEVVVDWRAEPDDVVELGASLGLLDPTRIDWEWAGPADLDPGLVGGQPMEGAEGLHAYVLDRIQIRQDGLECPGQVHPLGDLATEGIRVVFLCPEHVDRIDVRIAMLHDLHAAYRTFAEARGDLRPVRQVFTTARPEHRWHVQADSPRPAGALVAGWSEPMAGLLLATGLLAAAARRRQRRRVAAPLGKGE